MSDAVTTGLANIRDVGGLPLSQGGRIKAGVLLRSDGPMADDLPPTLSYWPPVVVIDLRETAELAASHPMTGPGVMIHSLPLLKAAGTAELAQADARGAGDLTTLYATMVEHSSVNLVQIARLVALSDGPCLIHCAAGKDRTGVAVAIILAAVGVPRPDIVSEYELTADNMPGVLERFRAQYLATHPGGTAEVPSLDLSELPAELLTTSTAAIENVLDLVQTEDGGAAGWLLAHGLKESELASLRTRLTDRE